MTPFLRAAGTARLADIEEISQGGDVLVLAPHPDDETLGCGGAIAALTDLGRRAQVVVVTDGGNSHPGSRSHPPPALRQLRAAEVTAAVDLLTVGQGPAPVLLGYPDGDAPEGAERVEEALTRIVPHVTPATRAIWASWGGDPHVDHERTARMAEALAARTGLALWSYPIWGRFEQDGAEFDPTAMVQFDAEPWAARKAAAIAAHVSQMTGLITDDPDGFRMIDAHQRHFLSTPEIFLRERPR